MDCQSQLIPHCHSIRLGFLVNVSFTKSGTDTAIRLQEIKYMPTGTCLDAMNYRLPITTDTPLQFTLSLGLTCFTEGGKYRLPVTTDTPLKFA